MAAGKISPRQIHSDMATDLELSEAVRAHCENDDPHSQYLKKSDFENLTREILGLVVDYLNKQKNIG
jgi:hypothetical protein